MSEALLLRYIDAMQRLRASAIMDGAQAGLYGHLVTRRGFTRAAQQWWQRWTVRAQDMRQAARHLRSNIREVRAWLGGILGSGLSN